ncbi:hypothetical protein TNCV_2813881 [Trichonephila clavipes]|nr:hypothetical protein TNCV_2813881 [Trichonephila clavipes]
MKFDVSTSFPVAFSPSRSEVTMDILFTHTMSGVNYPKGVRERGALSIFVRGGKTARAVPDSTLSGWHECNEFGGQSFIPLDIGRVDGDEMIPPARGVSQSD